MPSPVSSIIRQATRSAKQYNILTAPTHERYESGLCKTGHNFFAIQGKGIKGWSETYAKRPDNYHLLNGTNIPDWLELDFVLTQQKFGQFQALIPIAQKRHLPSISLEHTLPMPFWSQNTRNILANARGNLNVFISEYSLGQWQWQDRGDTFVVHHGVDTDVFTPWWENPNAQQHPQLLSIVNDWIGRDVPCGFKLWQRITQNLRVRVRGDTLGLSTPTKSVEELVNEYHNSRIFLNTSLISPIPTVLLEAASCGLAIVSTANCMIPEIIEHGVNGLISNDEKELREYCEMLLRDKDLCRKLGEKARETIVSKFSMNKFVENWNNLFDIAANTAIL